jgi:very-short-patch-repair endonuclease
MVQPVKKIIKTVNKIKKTKKQTKTVKKHKEYGTSKLEEKFAKEFLDKLGVKYVYQYKAESIGRYFDFYLPSVRLIIEIDGDYYHAYGKTREEMSPMQKKNTRVDEHKNKWALMNGIPILRIWEHDINKNPSEVMRVLKEKIGSCSEKVRIDENKKKRH